METIALDEWCVTFPLAAGRSRRTFVFTIPAVSFEYALDGARLIADGINESSGHVWKLTADEFTAERVA